MNRLHTFDVLAQWYREYLIAQGYRPRTVKDYCYELSFFRRFLAEYTEVGDIDELSGPPLRAYITYLYERGIGPVSIHNRLAALRSFFGAAYEEKKLYLDLRSHVNLPRLARRLPVDILSEQQAAALFDALETATRFAEIRTIDQAATLRDRAMLEILYSTGMRLGELRHLGLGDVDYENALVFIRQGKGGRDRVVPIGRTALECVRRYVTEARPLLTQPTCENLFVTRYGGPVGGYTVRQSVCKALALAGIDKHVGVHDLRHTCATHMLNHGADVRYVQELLGHASLSSTQVYTHVSIRCLRETHERHHPREKGAV